MQLPDREISVRTLASLLLAPVIVAEILAELLFTGFTKEESYGTMAACSRFAARRMGISAYGGHLDQIARGPVLRLPQSPREPSVAQRVWPPGIAIL